MYIIPDSTSHTLLLARWKDKKGGETEAWMGESIWSGLRLGETEERRRRPSLWGLREGAQVLMGGKTVNSENG